MYTPTAIKMIVASTAVFAAILNAPPALSSPFSCLSFSTYDCVDTVPAISGGAGAASPNGTPNTAPTGSATPPSGAAASGAGS